MSFCLDLKHPKTGICGLKLPKYCEVVERSWNNKHQTAPLLCFWAQMSCIANARLYGFTYQVASMPTVGECIGFWVDAAPPFTRTKTSPRRTHQDSEVGEMSKALRFGKDVSEVRSLKNYQFLSPPNNAENLDGKQDLPKSSKMQDSSLGKVGGDSANSKSGKSGGTCNHLLSFTCRQMNDRWTCMNLYLMAVENIWHMESCPLRCFNGHLGTRYGLLQTKGWQALSSNAGGS